MIVHPLADKFPMLSQERMARLANSIKEHGQEDSIITHKGRLIDGRNRRKACEIAGVPPRFEERDFKDEADIALFIIKKNLERRDLDESQRAIIGAELEAIFAEEAKKRMGEGGKKKGVANLPPLESHGKAREQAAEAVNVSARIIQTAKTVLKNGTPELVQEVKQGNVSMNAAAAISQLTKKEQRKVVAKGPEAIQKRAAEMRKKEAGASDDAPAESYQHWNTPPTLRDWILEIGPIALDPCSNEWTLLEAAKAFVETEDGLSRDWLKESGGGLVYVNPPFGNTTPWAKKTVDEAVRGCEVIVLTKSMHTSPWYQVLARAAQVTCLLNTRVEYYKEKEKPKGKSPDFASTLFYFGPRWQRFCQVFKTLGFLAEQIKEDRYKKVAIPENRIVGDASEWVGTFEKKEEEVQTQNNAEKEAPNSALEDRDLKPDPSKCDGCTLLVAKLTRSAGLDLCDECLTKDTLPVNEAYAAQLARDTKPEKPTMITRSSGKQVLSFSLPKLPNVPANPITITQEKMPPGAVARSFNPPHGSASFPVWIDKEGNPVPEESTIKDVPNVRTSEKSEYRCTTEGCDDFGLFNKKCKDHASFVDRLNEALWRCDNLTEGQAAYETLREEAKTEGERQALFVAFVEGKKRKWPAPKEKNDDVFRKSIKAIRAIEADPYAKKKSTPRCNKANCKQPANVIDGLCYSHGTHPLREILTWLMETWLPPGWSFTIAAGKDNHGKEEPVTTTEEMLQVVAGLADRVVSCRTNQLTEDRAHFFFVDVEENKDICWLTATPKEEAIDKPEVKEPAPKEEDFVHIEVWVKPEHDECKKGGYELFHDEAREVQLTQKQFIAWQKDVRLAFRTSDWFESLSGDMARVPSREAGLQIYDRMMELARGKDERAQVNDFWQARLTKGFGAPTLSPREAFQQSAKKRGEKEKTVECLSCLSEIPLTHARSLREAWLCEACFIKYPPNLLGTVTAKTLYNKTFVRFGRTFSGLLENHFRLSTTEAHALKQDKRLSVTKTDGETLTLSEYETLAYYLPLIAEAKDQARFEQVEGLAKAYLPAFEMDQEALYEAMRKRREQLQKRAKPYSCHYCEKVFGESGRAIRHELDCDKRCAHKLQGGRCSNKAEVGEFCAEHQPKAKASPKPTPKPATTKKASPKKSKPIKSPLKKKTSAKTARKR